MARVNFGIIGTGWGASAFAEAARGICRPMFACGRNRQNTVEFCRKYGIDAAVGSVQDIPSAQACPLIIVSLPPDASFEVAEVLLSRGHYLLVDKPGAVESADLAAIAKGPHANRFAVAYQLRHEQRFQFLRDAITRGDIGKPLKAYLRMYLAPSLWSEARRKWALGPAAPSCWLEAGVHLLDMAAWLFGSAKLLGAANTYQFGQCVAGTAILSHGDFMVSTIEVSYLGGSENLRGLVEVQGDGGTAVVSRGSYSDMRTYAISQSAVGHVRRIHEDRENGTEGLLRNVLEAVRAKTDLRRLEGVVDANAAAALVEQATAITNFRFTAKEGGIVSCVG